MKQLNLYYLGGGGTNPDIPDGKTVTPINDVEIWQKCAGLDPVYNSLGAILADSGYTAALMSDDNAVDYLVRSTEWANEISVPELTGPTNRATGVTNAWGVFQTSNINNGAQVDVGDRVIYEFDNPISIVKYHQPKVSLGLATATYTYIIQGSNDKITWNDISDEDTINNYVDGIIKNTSNASAYKYICLYCTEQSGGSGHLVFQLNFYSTAIPLSETAMQYIGASDYASTTLLANATWCEAICNSDYISNIINTSVPTMTSNTTPEGQCFSKTYDGSNNAYPWKAFDKNNSTHWISAYNPSGEYIGYKFTTAKKIDVIKVKNSQTPFTILSSKYQVSNDGTNYTDIQTLIGSSTDSATIIYNNIENKTPYLYHRLLITSVTSPSGRCGYIELDFYGRENGGVQTWLKAANIKKNYYSLSQVLNDTATLSTLMASEDAVDYLVTVKSWISAIVSSENAMTAIGNSNYASNTLLADSTWCEAICNSEYFESVLNVKVPQMTSNTLPEGSVTASSTTGSGTGIYTTGSDYYWAFDRDNNTYVGNKGENTSGFRIIYEFPSEVTIYKSSMNAHTYRDAGTFEMHLQHYNETSSIWLDDATAFNIIANTTYTKNYTAPVTATKFSLYSPTLKTENHSLYIRDLQFYGRKDV